MTRQPEFIAALVAVGLIAACSMNQKPAAPPSHRIDIHSHSQPHLVRVKHVEMDLTADFERKILHGWAELAITRLDTSAPLIVDTRELKIERVETAVGEKGAS